MSNSRNCSMDELLVFVYGTLKCGQPLHNMGLAANIAGEAKFVSEGRTSTKFPLVIASRCNIPYLLDVPGTGNQVKGEIYAVDKIRLGILDEIEGYPHYYHRRLEPIDVLDQQSRIVRTELCFVYILSKFKDQLLRLPFLHNYDSAGDHGRPYKADEDDISDPDEVDV